MAVVDYAVLLIFAVMIERLVCQLSMIPKLKDRKTTTKKGFRKHGFIYYSFAICKQPLTVSSYSHQQNARN